MSAVYSETLADGGNLLVRYPVAADAQVMCDYVNTLSQEKTFVRLQGEVITLEEETAYLNNRLEKIKEGKGVLLLVFLDSILIGIAGIEMKTGVASHQGLLGISLSADHRGRGFGKILMKNLLSEAEKNISQLRIVVLTVYGNNEVGQKLYRYFGFVEYGRLPEGIKHRDSYVDSIYMYKKIR